MFNTHIGPDVCSGSESEHVGRIHEAAAAEARGERRAAAGETSLAHIITLPPHNPMMHEK